MVRRIAAFLLAAAVAGASAGEASRFRVSSAMVLVNASVVDSQGRPISGLPRESFRLFENHTEKKIAWFSEDQTPVSMVIVFDISGSMSGKLSRCAEAVADLLRSSQAGDEFALVAFSNQPQLVQPWTADEAAIPAALLNARAHGNTAAIDALHTAGAYARTGANARKLLFVLSDGGDNSSRWRETQVLHELQEMDLEVYAVDIRDAEFTPHIRSFSTAPVCSAVFAEAWRGVTSRWSGWGNWKAPWNASAVKFGRSTFWAIAPRKQRGTDASIPWR